MSLKFFKYEVVANVHDYNPPRGDDPSAGIPSIEELQNDVDAINEEIAEQIQRKLPAGASVIVEITEFRRGSLEVFATVWLIINVISVISGAIAFFEYVSRIIIPAVKRVLGSRLKSRNISVKVNPAKVPGQPSQAILALEDIPLTWILALTAFNTLLLILTLISVR